MHYEKSEYMKEANNDLIHAAAEYMSGSVYLLREQELICLNVAARLVPLTPEIALRSIKGQSLDTILPQEIIINSTGTHYLLTGKHVLYEGESAWILQLIPNSQGATIRNLNKISKAREIMLQVFSRIDSIATKQDEYDFILDSCALAIERVTLCSLMIIQENGGKGENATGGEKTARVVAARGFLDDVIGLEMDLKDVFLFSATNGKIDRVVTINDLEEYMDSYHEEVKAEENNQMLKSTLSAPIYVDGRLYAILNFDSLQKNSFTRDDEELLYLVKSNIEIILANHQMHERILYMSQRDLLTGFYNRTYLQEYLQRHARDSFMVGAFDLNGLKKTNDRYGHAAGDELIRSFSEIIPRYFPADTIFFRMGGDEFICLLPSLNEQEALECVRLLREDLYASPYPRRISFSCGFAHHTENANFEETAHRADAKMYEEKQAFYRSERG